MDQEHHSPYYQWPFYYPPSCYQSPNPVHPPHYEQNYKNQNWELEKEDLNKKINSLEECVLRLQRQLALEIEKNQDQDTDRVEKKKKRKQFKKRFGCPYKQCHCKYGSTLALNLHIKLKHNGGTKKEREAYAKLMLEYELRGQEIPKINCDFPPGFLQEFRAKYQKRLLKKIKVRDSESKQLF